MSLKKAYFLLSTPHYHLILPYLQRSTANRTLSAASEGTNAVKHEESDIKYLASSPVRNGKKAKTTTETKPKLSSVSTTGSTVKPEYPTFNDYFLEEMRDSKAPANPYMVEEDYDSEEDGDGVAI